MRRRPVTPSEEALWRKAVRDVRRLDSGPAPARPVDPGGAKKGVLPPAPLGAGKTPNKRQPTLSPRQLDPFQAGDPRAERHVRRGRKRIDATLDLHGQTQTTARATFYGFLLEARSRGYECILVITGKGAARRGAGRGILQARFGEWLREDSFRQHIVRAAPAHPRHGGGGAFYVFLKTARR